MNAQQQGRPLPPGQVSAQHSHGRLVRSLSQAFLAPADLQTKGSVGWPRLRRKPLLSSSGQHSAACAKDGAVPCPNASEVAQPSLPVTAAQRLGMFGCPAMLTISESCPGSALAPCRGMGDPQCSQRTLTPQKGGHPSSVPFSCLSPFLLCLPVWILYLSPTCCILPRVTLHPMHG